MHTNMSVTDVGRHALPPTVHNEGHSPFCSGSPSVNTILSQWASPPCPRPLVPCHISFLIRFGTKCGTECVGEGEKSETRRMEGEQICRTAWRPAWGHACHGSFHPSHLLAAAYVRKSTYCTWASAELRRVGGGRETGAPQASAPL